jgi:hypothetical protein
LAESGLSEKYSAVEIDRTSEAGLPDFSNTILAISAQLTNGPSLVIL